MDLNSVSETVVVSKNLAFDTIMRNHLHLAWMYEPKEYASKGVASPLISGGSGAPFIDALFGGNTY